LVTQEKVTRAPQAGESFRLGFGCGAQNICAVTRVRQFALEFRSFRLWNHGGMRVFGPDFINAL
jgi:hypothetical protein